MRTRLKESNAQKQVAIDLGDVIMSKRSEAEERVSAMEHQSSALELKCSTMEEKYEAQVKRNEELRQTSNTVALKAAEICDAANANEQTLVMELNMMEGQNGVLEEQVANLKQELKKEHKEWVASHKAIVNIKQRLCELEPLVFQNHQLREQLRESQRQKAVIKSQRGKSLVKPIPKLGCIQSQTAIDSFFDLSTCQQLTPDQRDSKEF